MKENEPNRNHPVNFAWFADNYVLEKYQILYFQEEARRDALLYGHIIVAYHQGELLYKGDLLDEIDREYAQEQVELWISALERASQDDWEGVRDILQEYAHLALNVSTAAFEDEYPTELLEKHLEITSRYEKRGIAFLNFARSLFTAAE